MPRWAEADKLGRSAVCPQALGGQPLGLLPEVRPAIGKSERAAIPVRGERRAGLVWSDGGSGNWATYDDPPAKPSFAAETIRITFGPLGQGSRATCPYQSREHALASAQLKLPLRPPRFDPEELARIALRKRLHGVPTSAAMWYDVQTVRLSE